MVSSKTFIVALRWFMSLWVSSSSATIAVFTVKTMVRFWIIIIMNPIIYKTRTFSTTSCSIMIICIIWRRIRRFLHLALWFFLSWFLISLLLQNRRHKLLLSLLVFLSFFCNIFIPVLFLIIHVMFLTQLRLSVSTSDFIFNIVI